MRTVRKGHDSMVRTDGHTLSEKRNYQVTNSMFGASRKKFVEGVDSDYHDENMYYSQSSMFPHRSEKDMLASPSTSGQLCSIWGKISEKRIHEEFNSLLSIMSKRDRNLFRIRTLVFLKEVDSEL
ncbi:CCR4-NOT transcription complex, subunit 2, isoform CRA_d [Mus musculus]|nr:CCR4-NOT transcription complex, subunit 2, isoform CRA_d [Mus musculus]